jgi:transporter family-2 protein
MWLLFLVAFVIGAFMPIQAGLNSQLRYVLGHPMLASLVSFGVGTAIIGILNVAAGAPLSQLSRLDQTPWWMWLGGLLGAVYVTAALVLAPRLGAGTLIAVSMAGQIVGSIIIDHYGWLGYAAHPASLPRIAGAILLIAGVVLIQRY